MKEALANGRLADVDATALAAALAQPWASIVLSGAATVAQLQSNVAALELVDDVEIDAFAAKVESPDEYWKARASLPWT